MLRDASIEEKIKLKEWFPNLNVDQTVVSGEETSAYNCIGWTIRAVGAWIWPGDTLELFDTFYGMCGFERASSGPIAAWGIDGRDMKHGSVSGPHHGPRWESKCGWSLRIQHDLNELESPDSYGKVVAFYERKKAPSESMIRAIEVVNEGRFAMPTNEQIAVVRAAAQGLPANLRAQFEQAFAAWKATWSAPHVAISSNPRAVTYVREFQELIALGPNIIPAIVEKLLEPDNFFALQLYDALQRRHNLIVALDLSSFEVFQGEQGRARRTIERFSNSLRR